jgi:hypothetical protein
MPNCTMDRLDCAEAGQMQCLVRWLVARKALLRDLARCTSNVKLSSGLIYRLTFPDGAQMTIGDECGTR